MMAFTKISIVLIVVAAVALGAYGFQILRPGIDEKIMLYVVSPTPDINYLVGAHQKAKNVQDLQDNRFDSINGTPNRDITPSSVPAATQIVAGTVIRENIICPPCAPAEGLCSPCAPFSFTVEESNNDQITIRANDAYKVKVGEKYIFTVSSNAKDGWNLVSAKPQ